MKSILTQALEVRQQVKEFNKNFGNLEKGLKALDKQEDEIRDWEEQFYRFFKDNEEAERAMLEYCWYDELRGE